MNNSNLGYVNSHRLLLEASTAYLRLLVKGVDTPIQG